MAFPPSWPWLEFGSQLLELNFTFFLLSFRPTLAPISQLSLSLERRREDIYYQLVLLHSRQWFSIPTSRTGSCTETRYRHSILASFFAAFFKFVGYSALHCQVLCTLQTTTSPESTPALCVIAIGVCSIEIGYLEREKSIMYFKSREVVRSFIGKYRCC